MSDQKRDATANYCRDYLRKLCHRGSCKFEHPNDKEVCEALGVEVAFCHDYQNPSGCSRNHCRFVHCTKVEASLFDRIGELPMHVKNSMPELVKLYGFEGEPMKPPPPSTLPVCKDFMNGRCSRGRGCRFRHATQAEIDYESRMQQNNVQNNVPMMGAKRMRAPPFMMHPAAMGPPMGMGGPPKRFRPAFEAQDAYGHADYPDTDYIERGMLGAAPRYENDAGMKSQVEWKLQMRISELETQVVRLKAANEMLLEQNARNRNSAASASSLSSAPNQSLISYPINTSMR